MTDKPKHSPLGASSAGRWFNCAASVALLASLPYEIEEPSEHSRLGTEAHHLAAYCLQNEDDAETFIDTNFDGEFVEPITADMARAVQEYLDDIRRVRDAEPDCELFVEQRFALTEIDDMLWGQNDCALWAPASKTLYLWDYKHGVGVTVPIEDNVQIRYYAQGAWTQFRDLEPEKIVVTIVQPRAPGRTIKSETITPLDLFDFSLDLEAAVARTRAPDAQLTPGPWCDNTFCKGRARCPALRDKALAAAHDHKGKIADPNLFSPAELGKRLREAEALNSYLKALWEFAEREAAKGRMPVGWKHVQGNGKRTWNPALAETEIAAAIANQTNAVSPWKPRELLTAPQLEKELGKKSFAALLKAHADKNENQKLVTTKPGGVSLAPVEDARPAYTGDNGDGFEAINPKG